ncbi:metalloregulator ArsR/SmtB family transcription factor [bacterium]|nr:metalloregulator ArsR/SmtB family transcription factor [bacterium]
MHNLALLFRALAYETRLQILALILSHGELCVCDFEHVLDITQSKASRHLRYLLNAGFLEDRREAIWIHYRLAEKMDAEHKMILDAAYQVIGEKRMREHEKKLSAWLKQKKCGSTNAKDSLEVRSRTSVHT